METAHKKTKKKPNQLRSKRHNKGCDLFISRSILLTLITKYVSHRKRVRIILPVISQHRILSLEFMLKPLNCTKISAYL